MRFPAKPVLLAITFAASLATSVADAQPAAATPTPLTANLDNRPFRGGPVVSNPSVTTQPTDAATGVVSSTNPGAGGPSLGVDIARMFAAMVIVLAIIGLAYWIVRRLYGGNVGAGSLRVVKVLSRTPLAPRQQVMLLQVGQRIVVVGESAGVLTSLAQIEDADEVAQLLGQIEGEQMRRAASFGGVFGRSQKSFDESIADGTTVASLNMTETSDERGDDDGTPRDLAEQKSELAGLLEKVRSLRGQIGK